MVTERLLVKTFPLITEKLTLERGDMTLPGPEDYSVAEPPNDSIQKLLSRTMKEISSHWITYFFFFISQRILLL